MAEVINMPRLSDTMEEGTVAKWLVKVGEKINEGDIIAEIETDKATMEFESFYDGTLLHIGIQEGETAPIDVLLAIIGEKDEDISELLKGTQKVSEKKETKKEVTISSEAKKLPDDVEIITMPRLSDTMTEGTVATWLKKEGDAVEEGDILAEIETDKATMEFESFYSGILLKIGINEGESALVDSVLAIIGPKGTDVSGIIEDYRKESQINVSVSDQTVDQIEKKEANDTKVNSETIKETTKAPSHNTIIKGGRVFVSPLARKLAKEKGININQIQGSGENGRIVKRDVENYTPIQAGTGSYAPVGEESFEEIKNSQMRKTIAKRLGESKFSAPHYYLTVELDMDHAMASRAAINADPNVKISYNDMIIKACAMALSKHPRVNTQWTNEATRIAKHIHIGVAVAVEDGLVVPVLKFADQMSFNEIGASVKDLAGRARNKKLTPEEMEGSTFTVSNLGMFGIKEFTSIINQPNSAILSVGTIVQKPVVKSGQVAIGNTMIVTLACDHRTVDGVTGATFLQTLRKFIENPVTMFV